MFVEVNEEGLAFARKYRPTDFDGYIGNTDVKDTVMRYLMRGRPQTILIQGESGCGKTTLARIISREYRCENRDEEKGACGTCMTCQMFSEYIRLGKSDMLTDIYEIDASKAGSKNDVDSMLESMEYPAMSGDWKVYIMDEAHLLSEGAMGRLLKSLEEPPEGVLIILCTTDPDKLLPTIKNRCQLKLKITKPSTTELVDLLQKVCLYEGKDYDLEGLRMVVGRSDNVIRDSLNNLETVLTTHGDSRAESVSDEFHQVTDKIVYDFYKAYLDEDYTGYADIMYRIKTEYSFPQFISSLTTFTVRGLYILNSVAVEGLTEDEMKSQMDLFSRFSPSDIARVLSELKKLPVGNIEANLLTFIYCKNQGTVIDTKVFQLPEETSVNTETKFRNDNLKKLEEHKFQKGMASVQSEFKSVGLSDMASMFNIKKVSDVE